MVQLVDHPKQCSPGGQPHSLRSSGCLRSPLPSCWTWQLPRVSCCCETENRPPPAYLQVWHQVQVQVVRRRWRGKRSLQSVLQYATPQPNFWNKGENRNNVRKKNNAYTIIPGVLSIAFPLLDVADEHENEQKRDYYPQKGPDLGLRQAKAVVLRLTSNAVPVRVCGNTVSLAAVLCRLDILVRRLGKWGSARMIILIRRGRKGWVWIVHICSSIRMRIMLCGGRGWWWLVRISTSLRRLVGGSVATHWHCGVIIPSLLVPLALLLTADLFILHILHILLLVRITGVEVVSTIGIGAAIVMQLQLQRVLLSVPRVVGVEGVARVGCWKK